MSTQNQEYRVKYRDKNSKKKFNSELKPEKKNTQTALVISVDVKGCFSLLNKKSIYVHQAPKKPKLIIVGDLISIYERLGKYFLEKIEKRKNVLCRNDLNTYELKYVGANLDNVFIFTSLSVPEPRFGFIDRVICSAILNNINPIIVFTKTDTVETIPGNLQNEINYYQNIGHQVFLISALKKKGLTQLLAEMKNKISLFCGQSGVGKTTLMNILVPEANRKVGELSKSYNKGRHITSSSLMIKLKNNGYIIDTPGIKTFSISTTNAQDYQKGFLEIFSNSGKCKFKDCLHNSEPQCEITKMVSQGIISKRRHDTYITMLDEAKKAINK